nr:hypothetical protein Hi04_10k_c5548_00007 [uncultured bacterium]
MGVLFGKVAFDGRPLGQDELDRARPLLAPYGPDGEAVLCKDNFALMFGAFCTTPESRREVQPHIARSGLVFLWDGRLDNRDELIGEFKGELANTSTDLAIVVRQYERWGPESFPKLIGDWTVSIWDPHTQSLVLAKDFIGARHLYYCVEKNAVTWCSILDPLVLLAQHTFALEEEYIAGWLSYFPAAHLSPYAGIYAVPPSSFLSLRKHGRKLRKYWDFDPGKHIHLRDDREYEDGFREALARSVMRRLRADTTVVAELSGGMDSSSIVCVADDAISRGGMQTHRLETLSYHDDSEPNWNEQPYFTIVEQKRGRCGFHVNLCGHQTFNFAVKAQQFIAAPSHVPQAGECVMQAATWMTSEGARVVLSGIGGDEVTGGVPTPLPELADLLVGAQLKSLTRSLKRWALSARRPWIHLFLDTLRCFLPGLLISLPEHLRPPDWLTAEFVARNRNAFSGYRTRLKIMGACPSFQENVCTLENIRRQVASFPLLLNPRREVRYPYLDRDFLEFVYALPREQLLRPGQRRSLMRRGLAGIVPDEILNRKRKAFVSRGGLLDVRSAWQQLAKVELQFVASKIGIVDGERFSSAMREACNGKETRVLTILRALALEYWLRSITSRDQISNLQLSSHRTANQYCSALSRWLHEGSAG